MHKEAPTLSQVRVCSSQKTHERPTAGFLRSVQMEPVCVSLPTQRTRANHFVGLQPNASAPLLRRATNNLIAAAKWSRRWKRGSAAKSGSPNQRGVLGKDQE